MTPTEHDANPGPGLRVFVGTGCLVLGILLMWSSAVQLGRGDSPMLVVGGGVLAVAGVILITGGILERRRDHEDRSGR